MARRSRQWGRLHRCARARCSRNAVDRARSSPARRRRDRASRGTGARLGRGQARRCGARLAHSHRRDDGVSAARASRRSRSIPVRRCGTTSIPPRRAPHPAETDDRGRLTITREPTRQPALKFVSSAARRLRCGASVRTFPAHLRRSMPRSRVPNRRLLIFTICRCTSTLSCARHDGVVRPRVPVSRIARDYHRHRARRGRARTESEVPRMGSRRNRWLRTGDGHLR